MLGPATLSVREPPPLPANAGQLPAPAPAPALAPAPVCSVGANDSDGEMAEMGDVGECGRE